MKETNNISLSGIAFTMDAEAVEALNDYLDKLNRFYDKTDGGNEIVTDIETRIAELILDKQDNKTVVSLARIQSIISQLGSPEDIEEESPEQAHHTAPTSNISRRLYRNGERAQLGGVCAGLGTYFDIDPVWIRIGIFVPLLLVILLHNSLGTFFAQLFGVFVLLYIILWLAIPMAKTARQKLEMTGEKIDASTIANRTMSAREIQEEKTRSVISEILRILGQIILFLVQGARYLHHALPDRRHHIAHRRHHTGSLVHPRNIPDVRPYTDNDVHHLDRRRHIRSSCPSHCCHTYCWARSSTSISANASRPSSASSGS